MSFKGGRIRSSGFDEALLEEDIWEGDLAEDDFEVKRIEDARSGRKTRYDRLHRQF